MSGSDEMTGDTGAIARRHGFSRDAAEAALKALRSGSGRMAQFSHPELGGMGQWSPGMTMIGTMSDRGLKARVAALFDELAGAPIPERDAEAGSGEPDRTGKDWWPAELGRPSSTGAQNDMRYALFPDERRLAIRDGGIVRVYDTGEYRISGFGQQQGGVQTLSLLGQTGSISLDDLSPVDDATGGHQAANPPARPRSEPRQAEPRPSGQDDAIGTLDRLSDLHRRGVLSDREFAAKKADLLARI